MTSEKLRVDNRTGIRNLCAVAVHLLQTMPVNAATKFAVRTVIREAINKSCPDYKGNSNYRNVRYISTGAQGDLEAGGGRLVADHAIPVSLALSKIYECNPSTTEQLVSLVREFSTMVLITENEDRRLRDAGLVKTMPIEWDGKATLARYAHVGIEVFETHADEAYQFTRVEPASSSRA